MPFVLVSCVEQFAVMVFCFVVLVDWDDGVGCLVVLLRFYQNAILLYLCARDMMTTLFGSAVTNMESAKERDKGSWA